MFVLTAYHVHAHGVPWHAAESEVHVPAGNSGVYTVETAVVCGGVECFLQEVKEEDEGVREEDGGAREEGVVVM